MSANREFRVQIDALIKNDNYFYVEENKKRGKFSLYRKSAQVCPEKGLAFTYQHEGEFSNYQVLLDYIRDSTVKLRNYCRITRPINIPSETSPFDSA